jgi:VRR-NUC domain-containing protein
VSIDVRPTEAQCQATIVAAAQMFGWLVHAERPAVRQSGRWSTPIQGTPGFPDLVLCHPYHRRLWFIELKRRPNRVEPAQQRWLDTLAIHTDTRVVYVPEQMDALLRDLARPTEEEP